MLCYANSRRLEDDTCKLTYLIQDILRIQDSSETFGPLPGTQPARPPDEGNMYE